MMLITGASALLLLLVCTSSLSAPTYPYNYCQAPSTVGSTPTNYKLEFVQTITRHGDRTTLTLLPGDTNQFLCNLTTFMLPDLSSAPKAEIPRLFRKKYLPGREVVSGTCNFGQLTQTGYNQHVQLGSNLRELYVNNYKFLSPELDSSEVWIRSTDIYRTVQSVQANLIGFFPRNASSGTSIPIFDLHTMDQVNEDMYPNYNLCPRAQKVFKQVNAQAAFVKYDNSLAPLKTAVAKALGVENSPDWNDLFDAFNVLTCYNLPYPGALPAKSVQQIFDAANWEYNYQLQNAGLVKLWIGGFLAELVQNIQDKVSGELSLKYLHFSGHDTTLAPLMTALGVYDGYWPPYASHSQIELYSDDTGSKATQYYVQVKYQGIARIARGCNSTFCPLTEFLTNIAPYVSENYVADCNADNDAGWSGNVARQ